MEAKDRRPSSDRSRLPEWARGRWDRTRGTDRGRRGRIRGRPRGDSHSRAPCRVRSGVVPWGGPLAGWVSGGEVGSPMARICVMGTGSVRNAMNVRGSWQVGQRRGNTSRPTLRVGARWPGGRPIWRAGRGWSWVIGVVGSLAGETGPATSGEVRDRNGGPERRGRYPPGPVR